MTDEYTWTIECDRLERMYVPSKDFDDENKHLLQGEDVLFIGGFDELDADYSHSSHLFYISNEGWAYVMSSGCSCWDDSDAQDEWHNRKLFKTRKEFIKFLKDNFKLFKDYKLAKKAIKDVNKKTVVLGNKNSLKAIDQITHLRNEGIL